MIENDIRPDDLMYGASISMLTDLGRMLTRRSEFTDVDCPACTSGFSDLLHRKYGLEYHSCRECDTIYVNPRPTPELLAWFYRGSANYAYWCKHIFPVSEEARRKSIFVPRVDMVLHYCKTFGVDMGSLLEIGSGFGTFLDEMTSRQAFKAIHGIEPTPELARACCERGLAVWDARFEDIYCDPAIGHDVIASFEVIEHVFSPYRFVTKCLSLLHPGGLLFLTCPNGQGFDFVTLGQQCGNMDHEHLNYFNPDSLAILLRNCGFEVLDVQTPGKLDAELVRKQVLSGEFSLAQQPFLHQVLIERWADCGAAFQKFLSDNLLSSSMMIVARKRGSA